MPTPLKLSVRKVRFCPGFRACDRLAYAILFIRRRLPRLVVDPIPEIAIRCVDARLCCYHIIELQVGVRL
jgi:hypothetical protein